MKQVILNEIQNYYNEFIRSQDINSFVILYGGSTYKQRSKSDIDILFYIENPLSDVSLNIIGFIDKLHHKYDLSKDDEVPAENKLLYTGNEIVDAAHLACFNKEESPDRIVDAIEKNPPFLASYEMKLRLLINACTTPNIVFGNVGLANKHISNISRAVTILSILLQNRTKFTMNHLYECLVDAGPGRQGELFLGYKTEYPEVKIKLQYVLLSNLNELERDGYIAKDGFNYKLLVSKKDLIQSLDIAPNDYEKSTILSNESAVKARHYFDSAIDIGLNFKLRKKVRESLITESQRDKIMLAELPEKGKELDLLLKEFREEILPYCYNFSSPSFMGFPDAGNSVAGITGALMADFLQQNLINQSFCSPSGTFVEISVIRWLREVVGYNNFSHVEDIFSVGGIITGGGTGSNAIAIMLARENFKKNTMIDGVCKNNDYYLIVPKGIGHYSVKSAQMWTGCGNSLLEVPTKNFQYDLNELKNTLHTYKGRVMGLVAYVGDSRTMTIDRLEEIAKLVKSIDPNIWLHADACHGFSLGLSNKLKYKIKGIEKFDSITTDPHKVMNIPYTLSALLVKNPELLKTISSLSDLIMQEQYAFGQITPNIGSKSWMSLKLWFAIKNIGREGFEDIINSRHETALEFYNILSNSPDFILINEVHINAVAFMYVGNLNKKELDKINYINKKIHSIMIKEGEYHLHQFSIPDDGLFKQGKLLYPHRFMSGNPNIKTQDLHDVLNYIRKIASSIQL